MTQFITIATFFALSLLFFSIGIDRDIERKEAENQAFYCDIKREC